jgi:DME family drug/metabolite transporter
MSAARARLAILGAALLFSTSGVAIKGCTLGAWEVASFRSGVAALAMLLLVPAARRRWTWRTVAVSIAYAATMILFVAATKRTTAASTIFLQSTAPLYILLFAPWVLREPVRGRDLAFMVTLAAGMSLFFVGVDTPNATAPDPALGNLLAAASGVSWAATVMGLRATARAPDSPRSESVVLLGNVIAFIAALPFALPVAAFGAADALVVGYLGLLQTALAYLLLTAGIRHVTALSAAMLLLVEPALNPLWVWLAHDEVPSLLAIAGGATILAATAFKSWVDARRPH